MSTDQSIDEKLILEILQTLVSKPEDIVINRKVEEQGVILYVKVNAFDMRIVIGKNGSMATALKTVIKAVGKANNTNVKIVFEEPNDRTVFKPERKYDFDASGESSFNFETNEVEHRQILPKIAENHTQNVVESQKQAEVARANLDHDLDDLVIN